MIRIGRYSIDLATGRSLTLVVLVRTTPMDKGCYGCPAVGVQREWGVRTRKQKERALALAEETMKSR